MSTLYDEWLSKEYEKEEQRKRELYPDRGMYAELNGEKVTVVFKNGNSATGTLWKTYNKDAYELAGFGVHNIHFTLKDITSIRLAR